MSGAGGRMAADANSAASAGRGGRMAADAENGAGRRVSVYLENEYEGDDFGAIFDFDYGKTARDVAAAVLEDAKCPYDAEVNVLLTGGSAISEINKETRGIDGPTDVLSFPAVDYLSPADFSAAAEDPAGSFDPESGNLLLGDILINVERVGSQAAEYGHSARREFAFLIAHSLLHLIGYDHMEEREADVMFGIQERILTALHITREG